MSNFTVELKDNEKDAYIKTRFADTDYLDIKIKVALGGLLKSTYNYAWDETKTRFQLFPVKETQLSISRVAIESITNAGFHLICVSHNSIHPISALFSVYDV
jgi:hypothetical protein